MKKFSLLQAATRTSLNKNPKAGYSLLELILCIGMMGIFFHYSVTLIRPLYKTLVDLEAWHFKALCFHMQSLAIIKNLPYTLAINPATSAYLSPVYSALLTPQVKLGAHEPLYGPPSNPYQLITTATTFAHNTITFYPSGAIQPGTLYLHSAFAHYQMAVSIDIGTPAHVQIYAYQHGWQKIK